MTNPRSDTATPPSRPVNLRVRDDLRAIIDRAASLQGRTRSEFMLDAARRAAEDAILDQTLVRVDADVFDDLAKAIDDPTRGEGFERLMSAPTPWEDEPSKSAK